MNTTTKRWFGALFVVLVVGCSNRCFADSTQSDDKQLDAAIGFESASDSYYLTVRNLSDDFLCLSADQFDTGKGSITLRNNGRTAPLRTHREPPAPITSLKFNFAEPYFFLQPHEQRKVYIDTDNFITTPTVYTYEIVFSYYSCRDIVSLERTGARKDIPGRAIDEKGSIDMGLRQAGQKR